MSLSINRDTRLCMSLSGRPGNFGTRFQNFLYQAMGLNYVYKAFTTRDLPAAIGGIRALGIRGCAVSMPFKEACIPLVDTLDASAEAIASVNTIVNDEGHLRAYNTDYIAIRKLIDSHGLKPETKLALRGSGGMAKAVACAFRDAGFKWGHIVARNEAAGRKLAQTCGFSWAADTSGLDAALLINVTPIGMEGPEADQLAFDRVDVERATVVFDVVALPPETPLIRLARSLGKPVITGAEVIVLQAVEQFVLYTGVRPDGALIAEAAAHALS
ncbi:shikimate 5-dehydrogenase [Dyella mobilis]|uniref:Shikimate 5-dehydrogenase n=1 Tax=Dyella mobilis TaxID=1849582 RepID=A0ABS2KEK8_9GAMM|nr:shikimate 5-dehydrogenase [Dyella mobilis]MBM7129192.1 shikimate 5-dehydrogenase [Dyella mobilis]GLQ98486.1 shikimate 5-dehydrogenase [Dyella mobilis]